MTSRPAEPARCAWDRDDLPSGDEKVIAVRAMFDAIAPRYDLVNRVMTFRLDVRWRRLAVRSLVDGAGSLGHGALGHGALGPGSLVADLASGTGDLCVELASNGLRPISVDLSFGMLAADRSGAPRVQADVLHLPLASASVDGATCGFALRNLTELGPFFDELARVVRPGGRIALLDVATPANPIVRAGHAVYFGKIVPMVGALLSDGAAYRYLPRSVAYLPAPVVMMDRLRHAGFANGERRLLSGGITQLITGTRR